MKRWSKFLLLLETILILTLCTGCWNYREIEKTTIVSGIAIDKGTNGYKYHLTYEVLHFPGGNGQSIEASILESDGDSVFDAIRSAVTEVDKKLYFSNCRVVIICKDLAREGIEPFMDFFLRDAEPRISLLFAVSDEDTAEKILSNGTNTKESVAFKLGGIMEDTQSVYGHILPLPLYQVYNALHSESQALTLPDIKLVKIGKNLEPQIGTNVIFHRGKMVGFMPQDENLYYLMLKDKIKSGILMTDVPSGKKDISLEILKCKTKVKPVVSGNQVTMKIQIKLLASLGEESNDEKTYTIKNGELSRIEKAASKTLEEGLTNLIFDIQNNYGVDIFGFADKIKQDSPNDWVKLSKNWDQNFRHVKPEITADVKVVSTAAALPKVGRS